MNIGAKDENSLDDPYSKATRLVTYLFSLEFGLPPLYSEVNRVCRTKDKSLLRHLGPYIRALTTVCLEAEKNKQEKITTGIQILKQVGGNEFNPAGIFLLFKGAQL